MKIESQHFITITLLVGCVVLFVVKQESMGSAFLGLSIVHFILSHMD